jgi:agmatine deiminase
MGAAPSGRVTASGRGKRVSRAILCGIPKAVKARCWQPAEWAPHESVWVAWPSAQDLWGQHLAPAQAAFVAMCEAVADVDPLRQTARGERIQLLVPDESRRDEALRCLHRVDPTVHMIPFGDIWLRDTAPLFLVSNRDGLYAACFRFNGWGGKYILPGDEQVSARIARACELEITPYEWVLEGGSVEVDGEGTVLTTRQCLLNANRDAPKDERAVESRLRDALGVESVLWLDEGLANDHTDGHIDTIARFVQPGVVVCMEPVSDDPNRDVLREIRGQLRVMIDARGRRLEVVGVPSPGRVVGSEGDVMPASYVNFYVGNRAVVVPTYGSPHDDDAVSRIAALFPGRKTVGIDARAILTGGGAFHCITQQQPGGAG